MTPSNCYDDARRAAAYAKLEFHGTYLLAYRDLPRIFETHVRGKRALDFGCGTGRSSRFLCAHGFDPIGIDIAPDMIAKARAADPGGDYRLVGEGDFSAVGDLTFALVLAMFTFDNIPTMALKVDILQALGGMLDRDGRIVMVVSAPEIYWHEWVSFSTREYPENVHAESGDRVRIVITDIDDKRPVEDVLWTDAAYRVTFRHAGLEPVKTYKPLGRDDEPYPWVNETRIAPWVVYVLQRRSRVMGQEAPRSSS